MAFSIDMNRPNKQNFPPGWEAAIDPQSGRKYFANRSTQETRWDPPTSLNGPFSSSVSAANLVSTRSSSTHKSGGSGSHQSSHGRSDSSSTRANKMHSAPKRNVAFDDPRQLIPMTRSMLDQAAAFTSESISTDLELHSITPGQIADLYHIQYLGEACGENIAYTPLNPYQMSLTGVREEMEESRLDARIAALMAKLKKFEPKPYNDHEENLQQF